MSDHSSGTDSANWGPESMAWEVWSRSAIQKRLAQHARGIDRADEALLREAYHDDGTVDYGSLQGSAAEFAAAIAAMHDGAPMSSHRTSNLWIAIEGQSAISESYVMAGTATSTMTGVCGIASMWWTGSLSSPHRSPRSRDRLSHRSHLVLRARTSRGMQAVL